MMSNRYDAIVIGAGIHGAGCAQALAAAGHSCLVLDQAAGPAAATSSRSSKLIHGGLRYLESRQLNLVRECLRERTLLLRNAPALVKLVPFYLPVYKHSSRSAAKIKLGLHLYHLIAGDAPGNEYNSLPESEWEDLNGLNTDGLQRVYQYFDAQTDDKALTKAVLRSARGLGAKAAYDARVEQIELLEEGVRVNYLQQTTPASVEATVVINAAGPWVNRLLANVTPTQSAHPIELVQGAHLLLPDQKLRGIYYVEARNDQRGIFVMPWREQTLIGTTETAFTGDPATVEPTTEEVDYLLATARHHFPDAPFYRKHLTGQFAGLRVLPAGEGAFFRRPRETQMPVDRETQPRLLSLVGGKLTNYRATAEKCVAKLSDSLPARKAIAKTSELELSLSD